MAADSCDHETTLEVELDDNAAFVWREETVLGRQGEAGVRVRNRVALTRQGTSLLRADARVGGPAWRSPVVGGGMRISGTLVAAGPIARGWSTRITRRPPSCRSLTTWWWSPPSTATASSDDSSTRRRRRWANWRRRFPIHSCHRHHEPARVRLNGEDRFTVGARALPSTIGDSLSTAPA